MSNKTAMRYIILIVISFLIWLFIMLVQLIPVVENKPNNNFKINQTNEKQSQVVD